MLWRKIIAGALLGSAVGFAAQITQDYFCFGLFGFGSNRSSQCSFLNLIADQGLSSTAFNILKLNSAPAQLSQSFPDQYHSLARQLFYEAVVLELLKERGETATRSALILGFIG